MQALNVLEKQSTHYRLSFAYLAALVVIVLVALSQPVQAAKITPPSVPPAIAIPAGNEPFLVGHATGTQNYICLPSTDSESGVAFTLFTPQATLFDGKGKQVSTHFFSPNPAENGTIRAAWQDSKGTSTVWGMVQPGHSSTDPAFVAPGAVAWLLLTAAGTQHGPTGGDAMTATTFIHRVNTSGGVAPTTGCNSPAEIGNKAFVPYTTDYIFYRAAKK